MRDEERWIVSFLRFAVPTTRFSPPFVLVSFSVVFVALILALIVCIRRCRLSPSPLFRLDSSLRSLRSARRLSLWPFLNLLLSLLLRLLPPRRCPPCSSRPRPHIVREVLRDRSPRSLQMDGRQLARDSTNVDSETLHGRRCVSSRSLTSGCYLADTGRPRSSRTNMDAEDFHHDEHHPPQVWHRPRFAAEEPAQDGRRHPSSRCRDPHRDGEDDSEGCGQA